MFTTASPCPVQMMKANKAELLRCGSSSLTVRRNRWKRIRWIRVGQKAICKSKLWTQLAKANYQSKLQKKIAKANYQSKLQKKIAKANCQSKLQKQDLREKGKIRRLEKGSEKPRQWDPKHVENSYFIHRRQRKLQMESRIWSQNQVLHHTWSRSGSEVFAALITTTESVDFMMKQCQ